MEKKSIFRGLVALFLVFQSIMALAIVPIIVGAGAAAVLVYCMFADCGCTAPLSGPMVDTLYNQTCVNSCNAQDYDAEQLNNCINSCGGGNTSPPPAPTPSPTESVSGTGLVCW